MANEMILDKAYKNWIAELSKRYRNTQIKAAVALNSQMLQFYWGLGRDIVGIQSENKYGSRFYESLSRDLKEAIPDAKGFSTKNLYYIRNFYLMYAEKFPQLEGNFDEDNFPQLGGDLFRIPWGHHKLLIDKFFNAPETALFYVRETIKNGWSRSMLLNMLDLNLHQRQSRAITNFKTQLPPPTSDLAQELTKDPYTFDFLTLTEPYKERELKQALLNNITRFLLELGEGFAYVGQEVRLNVGETEQYPDLLFYNLNLRCYVVIELKTVKFEPGFLGQLGLYVTAVNHIKKTDKDNPTIGLLICKTKDDVLAQYSLEGYNIPLGISQYQLEKFLPDDFKSTLPSIEEIEALLDNEKKF